MQNNRIPSNNQNKLGVPEHRHNVLYSINQYVVPCSETAEKVSEAPKPADNRSSIPIEKPVKSDNLKGYLPNIDYSQKPEKKKLFDLAIAKGIKLSDGSTLLKPIIENPALKNYKVIPSAEEGKFDIINIEFKNGNAYKVIDKVITEKELKLNPYFYAGQIKKTGDNQYELTHFNDQNEPVTETLNSEECMTILAKEHSIF